MYVTIWGAVGYWFGMVAYAVAWTWGGRVERFGAAVLIVHCTIVTMNSFLTWEIGGVYLTGRIANYVRLLIFGWLCFRSDRWWPFLMTATIGLMCVVDVVGLLHPAISEWGAASARIGLGYLVDLTLILGVCERVLAGETPAGRAAWARSHIQTAARRRRSRRVRRSGEGLDVLRIERADGPPGRRPHLPA